MATIINADIDGLIESADNTGVLNIQTKGVTAISIDDAQKVSIDQTKLKIQGGTSGQVLTTDGSGNISWATASAGGASSLDGLSDAAVDSTSMLLGRNGVGASDLYNTSIGIGSLAANITGYSNTAIGYQSLFSNTEGFDNTAIGFYALYSNTTGYNNTAIGYQSLYSNTTGFENTAIGFYALYSNTEGFDNTAIGYQALFTTTTGSNNIGIGNGATASSATVSNEVTIGNDAVTSTRLKGKVSAKTFFSTSITDVNTLEVDKADVFSYTVTGATTFSVTGVPDSGLVCSFILEMTNGGSSTVTWWSGVKWEGGIEPTWTVAGLDLIGFYTRDGGTTWRAMVIAKDSK